VGRSSQVEHYKAVTVSGATDGGRVLCSCFHFHQTSLCVSRLLPMVFGKMASGGVQTCRCALRSMNSFADGLESNIAVSSVIMGYYKAVHEHHGGSPAAVLQRGLDPPTSTRACRRLASVSPCASMPSNLIALSLPMSHSQYPPHTKMPPSDYSTTLSVDPSEVYVNIEKSMGEQTRSLWVSPVTQHRGLLRGPQVIP
jgi:hypothetical protein